MIARSDIPRLGASLLALLILGPCAVAVSGQTPGPLKSGVALVPLDIRVTDAKGEPVTDLTAADFTVFEDDVRQETAHFFAPALTAFAVPPGTAPTDDGALAPRHRTFILVLGRGFLNAPVKGLDALIEFVSTRLLPNDQVGVLAYLRVADPTTDHAAVVRFLKRHRERHERIEGSLASVRSPMATRANDDTAFLDALFREPVGLTFREMPGATGHRAIGFQNLNYLHWAIDSARRLAGEKHLVFLSQQPLPFGRRLSWPDHPMVRAAAAGRVTISFLHTGGSSGSSIHRGRVRRPRATGDGSTSMLGIADSEFVAPTEHRAFTEQTGGLAAFYESAAPFLRLLERSSRAQYLIGYYPREATVTPGYRRIRVEARRSGLKVSYRHGYDPQPKEQYSEDMRRAAADDRVDTVISALADPEMTRYLRSAAMRIATPGLLPQGAGSVLPVTLSFDPSRIVFAPEKDGHRAILYLTVVVDGPGIPVAEHKQRVPLNLSAAEMRYASMDRPTSAFLSGPARVRAALLRFRRRCSLVFRWQLGHPVNADRQPQNSPSAASRSRVPTDQSKKSRQRQAHEITEVGLAAHGDGRILGVESRAVPSPYCSGPSALARECEIVLTAAMSREMSLTCRLRWETRY